MIAGAPQRLAPAAREEPASRRQHPGFSQVPNPNFDKLAERYLPNARR
jgi:hypothetical protein